MNFWGVEVKSGEPLKVMPGDGMILHISQAVLGETKKEKCSEPICLFVNVNKEKLVLGTLYAENLPQVQFDLVFEKDFELTHNWKHGSVYFYGYKAPNPFDEEINSDFDTDSDEELPTTLANKGKQAAKTKEEKHVEVEKSNAAKKKEAGSGKQKVKIVEPSKDSSDEDDENSDEDLSLSEDSAEDDLEDEDDSDASDESEETPQKVQVSKKRAAESASKTPVADKKAKVTPQKTDGKKVSGHVATPYPAKQNGKTPASKPSQQTPKSARTHTCNSCNKGFGSDKALESHTKAKHGGN